MDRKIDRLATLEFSSERKCMSTVCRNYQGTKGNTVMLKGASEKVLDLCTSRVQLDGSSAPWAQGEKA